MTPADKHCRNITWSSGFREGPPLTIFQAHSAVYFIAFHPFSPNFPTVSGKEQAAKKKKRKESDWRRVEIQYNPIFPVHCWITDWRRSKWGKGDKFWHCVKLGISINIFSWLKVTVQMSAWPTNELRVLKKGAGGYNLLRIFFKRRIGNIY